MLPEVVALVGEGLVALERARLVAPAQVPAATLEGLGDEVKITVYVGRAGAPGPGAILRHLRSSGVTAATALLGVDGVVDGLRRRARFFSANVDVPVMVLAVAEREAAVRALADMPASAAVTLERVRVDKGGGGPARDDAAIPDEDAGGLGLWHRRVVYTSEAARTGGRPLYVELVRQLRLAGAAGATVLRGVLGYAGNGPLQGERLLSVRRHSPLVITFVDRPSAMRRLWPTVDALTGEGELVTSEAVPAIQATGPGLRVGGLRLARPG
jgi:PII-like signaling protein